VLALRGAVVNAFTPEDVAFFRGPACSSLDRAFTSAAKTAQALSEERDRRDIARLGPGRRERGSLEQERAIALRRCERREAERAHYLDQTLELEIERDMARNDQEVRARNHVDLRGMAAVVAEVVQRQLAVHGVVVTEMQARDAANNATQAIAGVLADSEAA